jgi:cytoskeletal protein CcmA (bactofilin family)
MNVRTLSIAIVLGLVFAFPLPALAIVPRGGSTVVVGEAISDDLYVAGGTVDVTGQIDGDIVAAGGTVTLSGPVTGGILAAGGTVSIRGATGRSIRAAAGTLTLGGRVDGDAVLVGGTITVGQAAEIGRDLVAAGGGVRVSGNVRRNAWLTGGTVTIDGAIEGDVEAHADRIVVLPSARINGTLHYSAEQPIEVQTGAQVAGQITRVDRPSRPRMILSPGARLGFRFASRVLEAVWLLALGLILVAITPRGVQAVAERVRTRLGLSVLAGFVLCVVVPVAAVMLLLTIVGIPLALVAMLLYVATLYPGQVFVCSWLGDAVLRGLGRRGPSTSPYLAVTVGVIVLVVLVTIPFVGWIFRLLAIFAGFGALWAAIWSARVRSSPPATAGASS